MSVIGMIGMHALGKSTALLRWKANYGDRIEAYSLDDLRRDYPDDSAKLALCERCRRSNRVCVVESARGFSSWLGAFAPTDPVIMVYCSEPVARRYMVERRGGRPLTDFWTPRRLEYECRTRYFNFTRKRLTEGQVRLFEIADRERDWPAVDAYFGYLFRRLWNQSRGGNS